MSSSKTVLDPAFQGAGQKPGTEIWRVEDFQPVQIPKSEHGKFYMGDSYIILQTTQSNGGAYHYDIHFWIGKDTSQDEAGTAAIKTVELDAVLGGRAVQNREFQGHESDKFLSYFKPCIIPQEGGVASGFRKPEEKEFETRLYICKGKRAVRMKQVPFARSSLNHDDVFILDTKEKIYQFNGANSNIQERAKALEVVQFLKENCHEGTCAVAIVDDGKLDTESDSGEFWILFGGFAPIGRKVICDDDVPLEMTSAKLYSIDHAQLGPVEGELSKSLLGNDKCYILDCGAEVFVWFGRVTQVEERKAASKAAEEFVARENRPKATRITRVIQCYENLSFKSNFDCWPLGTAAPSAEEGRGKVAALLKQQGVGLKGIAKSGSPDNEEVPPLLEGGGKLEVWYIEGKTKTPLPKEDIGKFFSGDCYLILYTYHAGDRKEDYFLCSWFGTNSVQVDQETATELSNSMFESLKGRPVQGRIFEGKEPPQFVALFQPLVVLKGGLSSAYRNSLDEKGADVETYTPESISLIRVSGTGLHSNKALQVEAVATSLSSNESFLLQSGSSVFLWHGNQSTHETQQLAAKVAEFLKPGVTLKHAKEGTESASFWFALGGKQSYTSKKVSSETVREPHLFSILSNKGRFQVEEIYNFDQDDLLTEDMYILDTHAEVFVWIGQCVDSKERETAFKIGQKYIDMAAALEGLSSKVPLYKVTEANEPYFFITYFSWKPVKVPVQGNSFQKKVALLFGENHIVTERPNSGTQGGPRQRAEALAALTSAFNSSPGASNRSSQDMSNGNQGGLRQRVEALAALSSVFNPSSPQKGPLPPGKSQDISNGNQEGPRQRAEALAALSSAFNPSSTPKAPPNSQDTSNGNREGPRQRAEALAALSSAFNPSSKPKAPPPPPRPNSQDTSNGNQEGPRQRAEALAALSSAFNPSSTPKAPPPPPRSFGKSRDMSNGDQEGPRQRAEALAALSSAFNSSSTPKATPPPPRSTAKSRGSQRAVAVAALSQVLTSESEKITPDTSPAEMSTGGSSADSSPPSDIKGENTLSGFEESEAAIETEEKVQAPQVTETSVEASEPEQEVEQQVKNEIGGSTHYTFSYERLKSQSENPVTGINSKRREAYLSEEEFQTVFKMSREAFYKMPMWKQDLLKKKVDLF